METLSDIEVTASPSSSFGSGLLHLSSHRLPSAHLSQWCQVLSSSAGRDRVTLPQVLL